MAIGGRRLRELVISRAFASHLLAAQERLSASRGARSNTHNGSPTFGADIPAHRRRAPSDTPIRDFLDSYLHGAAAIRVLREYRDLALAEADGNSDAASRRGELDLAVARHWGKGTQPSPAQIAQARDGLTTLALIDAAEGYFGPTVMTRHSLLFRLEPPTDKTLEWLNGNPPENAYMRREWQRENDRLEPGNRLRVLAGLATQATDELCDRLGAELEVDLPRETPRPSGSDSIFGSRALGGGVLALNGQLERAQPNDSMSQLMGGSTLAARSLYKMYGSLLRQEAADHNSGVRPAVDMVVQAAAGIIGSRHSSLKQEENSPCSASAGRWGNWCGRPDGQTEGHDLWRSHQSITDGGRLARGGSVARGSGQFRRLSRVG